RVDVRALIAREVAVRGAETDDELAVDRTRVAGEAVRRDDGHTLRARRGRVAVRQVRVRAGAARDAGITRAEHAVARRARDAARDVAAVDEVVVALRRIAGPLRIARQPGVTADIGRTGQLGTASCDQHDTQGDPHGRNVHAQHLTFQVRYRDRVV